jgi:hypothetical protein
MDEPNSNDIEAIDDAGDRTTSPTPADLLTDLLGRSNISEVEVLSWQMKEMAREHQRALEPESLPETLELLRRLTARAQEQNQDRTLAPGLELIARRLSDLITAVTVKAGSA